MRTEHKLPREWSIQTRIGPAAINIIVDAAFLHSLPQSHIERHKHATCEFQFITGGSGVLCTDDAEYAVSVGNYCLIREGLYHLQKSDGEGCLQKCSFKFDFHAGNLADPLYSDEDAKVILESLNAVQLFHSRVTDSMETILRDIQKEMTDQAVGCYIKVQHLFSLLFIEIIRDIARQNKRIQQPAAFGSYLENRISIIENFFDLNFNYKATADDLCRLVHLSKSQLNRILNTKYKMTFKKKHMEAQIEHAKDLLIHTQLPIGLIAEKTGYAADSNFTAFFKHATGMSPKEYRKQNRMAFRQSSKQPYCSSTNLPIS